MSFRLLTLTSTQWVNFQIIIVCNGLLCSHKWSGKCIKGGNLHQWRHKQFSSQTTPALLRSSPAYGRSTSCRAWQSDRWPGLLGSSMAKGWNHPGARGSAGSSGNHGDSAGSSSRCHPDGYPARFRRLSAEDTGLGRVTITHMTNASPPEARAEEEEEEAWIDEPASLVGHKNILYVKTKVSEKIRIDVCENAKLYHAWWQRDQDNGESELAWVKLQENKTWYNTLDLSVMPWDSSTVSCAMLHLWFQYSQPLYQCYLQSKGL